MKYLFIVLAALSLFFFSLTPDVMAQPAAGEKLFQKLRCTKCHHPDKKINGPALKTIVRAYGTPEKLLGYFKGESDPIVEPGRAKTMKIRRKKIKKLQDDERQSLVDYFFSFQGAKDE